VRSIVGAFVIVVAGFHTLAAETGRSETGLAEDVTSVLVDVSDAPPPPEMTLLQVVILGVIEGLTEYLPVSSTGHLILAQRAMGMESSDAANAYAICIQVGAIGAVLLLYFGRVRQMFRSLLGLDKQGSRITLNILVAFLPAAVLGLLFDDVIGNLLFGVKPVIAAWVVGGVAILAVARWQKRSSHSGLALEDLTWKMALIIGFAQSLALWPGTSRSLATIVSGVLVGLSLPAAVEFSFLLGMITLSAATAYKGLQHGSAMIDAFGWTHLTIGLIVATVSALVAVKWMVAYLNHHGLAIFGYYRLLLGAAVGGLVAGGLL
jgi:undecaprenyl-diphosphatase